MKARETAQFRCLRCGVVGEMDVAEGILTLGIKHRPEDALAPTCACGNRTWVRVGSMTEYYRYSRREDVCRVGDHIDPRARVHRLLPRAQSPTDAGRLRVLYLEVRVCPEHVEVLRTHGLHGFFLVDDRA
jgi:hypothetical protein